MKGHTAMYVILGLMLVALLSRGAAAAGLMLSGGSVLEQESQVLTGQFAQKGGQTGSFNFQSAGGPAGFSLG
jgi:hypothetical protein